MNSLQLQVRSFVDRHALHAPLEHRVLDLASEVGELAKEVLRSTDYGRQAARLSPAFEAELGDVLFSLLGVANAAGVDAERALSATLAKYAGRLAAAGTAGSEAENNRSG